MGIDVNGAARLIGWAILTPKFLKEAVAGFFDPLR